MKTGEQIARDVREFVAWLIAIVPLFQKYGFHVDARWASLLADPQFIMLGTGAAVFCVVKVRQSRIAKILSLAEDKALDGLESRVR